VYQYEDNLDPGGGGSTDPPPAPPAQDPGPGDEIPVEDPVTVDPAPGPGDYVPVEEPAERPCIRWVVYERYVAGGPNPCPECAPLNGNIYEAGFGPEPPLHNHCHCWREFAWEECAERGGPNGEY
jgi:hypothetical protein